MDILTKAQMESKKSIFVPRTDSFSYQKFDRASKTWKTYKGGGGEKGFHGWTFDEDSQVVYDHYLTDVHEGRGGRYLFGSDADKKFAEKLRSIHGRDKTPRVTSSPRVISADTFRRNGRIFVKATDNSEWHYIKKGAGNSWDHHYWSRSTGKEINSPYQMSTKDAYDFYTNRATMGGIYRFYFGKDADDAYSKKAPSTPASTKSGRQSKPRTAGETKTAKKQASARASKPTQLPRKTIKGQKGYTLIEKTRHGYSVPSSTQGYWKKE